MGLWIYELAGRLPNGSSILLHCSLMDANKKLKETIPVHTVVQKWMKVIQEKGHPNTLLVFDSYYFSADTRQLLLQNDIKVCAAVNSSKFPAVVNILSRRISKAGDIEAAYNREHGEIVLGYYNPDPNVRIVPESLDRHFYSNHFTTQVGRKYVWSNTIFATRFKEEKKEKSLSIPAYDLYNVGFSICDKLNRSLRQKCFPYRCSKNKEGGSDLKRYFDFVLSCILHNTFKIYEYATETDQKGSDHLPFSEHCIVLSQELFDSTF